MVRKARYLALILVIALVAAACGDDGAADSTTTTQAPTTTQAATTTEAPTTTQAATTTAAPADASLEIGIVLPQTGDLAVLGAPATVAYCFDGGIGSPRYIRTMRFSGNACVARRNWIT